MARDGRDFVIGFITQRLMESVGLREGEKDGAGDFLVLTPGIGLDVTGDGLSQQYRTRWPSSIMWIVTSPLLEASGAFMVALETCRLGPEADGKVQGSWVEYLPQTLELERCIVVQRGCISSCNR